MATVIVEKWLRGRADATIIDNDRRVFEIDFVASAVGAAQDAGHHEN